MAKPLPSCLALTWLLIGCGSPPAPASTSSTSLAEAEAESAELEPAACSVERIEPEMALYCDFEAQVPTNELPAVRWSGPAFHLLEQRLIIVDAQARVFGPAERPAQPIATWLADPAPANPASADQPSADQPSADQPWVLAIADGLPASDAAELLAGLHAAARTEILVLVRSEDDEHVLPVPRSPDMLAEIARRLPSDLSQRAMQLAMTMREYAERCPAITTSLQNLAALAPEERCIGMAGGLARAIVGCECEQADEVMTLIYAISVGTVPPKGRVSAVPLILDPAASVSAASSATWGQLVGSQLSAATPHRLWIHRPQD